MNRSEPHPRKRLVNAGQPWTHSEKLQGRERETQELRKSTYPAWDAAAIYEQPIPHQT